VANRQDWIALIRQLATKYHVDPRAALAVASAEGLSGAAGDNNTSWGPFQLHVGGALPAGRDRAWAESPAGIDYALRQIAGVAKGLSGPAAIEAIVRQFERPADPTGEIARASQAYGSFAGGPPPIPHAAPGIPPVPTSAPVRQIPAHVLNVVNQSLSGTLGETNPDALEPMKLPTFVPRSAPSPAPRPTPRTTVASATAARPAQAGSEFTTVDAEGAPDANGVRHHAAYDWMLGGDNPVPALLGGTVIEAKPSRGSSGQVYGGTVKVQTTDGRVLVYRHVNPNVRVGQKVQAGQAVARVVRWLDNPKSSHAHVELWKTLQGGYKFDNMLDPLSLIGGAQ